MRLLYHRILDRVSEKGAGIVPRVLPTVDWRVSTLAGIGSVIVAIGCAVATPAAPPHLPSPPPSNQPADAAAGAVAEEIVTRTNDERRALRVPALVRSPALMRAAQIQADQMAAFGTMAHEFPDGAYPTLGSRLAAVSYQMSAAGENIAEGHPTAAAVIAGWMKSSGHRANILEVRFTEMGAAVSMSARGRRFYVQVFARPSK